MMNFGSMGWGMGFGWIIGLLFIGLLFWLLFTTLQNKRTSSETTDSAKEILRRRFARGEISEDKFKEMFKKLNQ